MNLYKQIAVVLCIIMINSSLYAFPLIKPQKKSVAVKVCDFIIAVSEDWKIKPEQSNLRDSYSFRKKSVDAVILCIQKTVTMEEWIKNSKRNLSFEFREYELLKGYPVQFYGKSAYWIVYKGKTRSSKLSIGKLLIVDLGKRGLILSMACPEIYYDEDSYLFDEFVEFILPGDYSFSE